MAGARVRGGPVRESGIAGARVRGGPVRESGIAGARVRGGPVRESGIAGARVRGGPVRESGIAGAWSAGPMPEGRTSRRRSGRGGQLPGTVIRPAERAVLRRMAGCAPLIPGIVLLLADGYRLGRLSLWRDEAYTVDAIGRPLPRVFAMLAHADAVNGAYYVLMHTWAGAAGTSPTALRLPSLLAMAVAAMVTAATGGRLARAGRLPAAGTDRCRGRAAVHRGPAGDPVRAGRPRLWARHHVRDGSDLPAARAHRRPLALVDGLRGGDHRGWPVQPAGLPAGGRARGDRVDRAGQAAGGAGPRPVRPRQAREPQGDRRNGGVARGTGPAAGPVSRWLTAVGVALAVLSPAAGGGRRAAPIRSAGWSGPAWPR